MCRAGGRRCPNCSSKLTGEYLKRHNQRRKDNRAQKKAILQWAKEQSIDAGFVESLKSKSQKEIRAWAQLAKAPQDLWEKPSQGPSTPLTSTKSSPLTETLNDSLREKYASSPHSVEELALRQRFGLRMPGVMVDASMDKWTFDDYEEWNREAQAWMKSHGVTEKDQDAIRYYSGSGSGEMNRVFFTKDGKGLEDPVLDRTWPTYTVNHPELWGELNKDTGNRTMPTIRDAVKQLDEFFEKLPDLEEFQRVYRGVGYREEFAFGATVETVEEWAREQFQTGTEVEFPSFTSTSRHAGMATEFTGGSGAGLVFEIATKKGAYVNPYSAYTDLEFEHLLARGTRFKVVGVDVADFVGHENENEAEWDEDDTYAVSTTVRRVVVQLIDVDAWDL